MLTVCCGLCLNQSVKINSKKKELPNKLPAFQIRSRATKLYEIDYCMSNYLYALGNELSSVALKLYTFLFFLILYFQHYSFVQEITFHEPEVFRSNCLGVPSRVFLIIVTLQLK